MKKYLQVYHDSMREWELWVLYVGMWWVYLFEKVDVGYRSFLKSNVNLKFDQKRVDNLMGLVVV